MPLSREDRIRLAFTALKKKVAKEGLDRVDARTVLAVAEIFDISPLAVQRIVKK